MKYPTVSDEVDQPAIYYDAKRHVMTTISTKSLKLKGISGDYVSSGLEGLLAGITRSF